MQTFRGAERGARQRSHCIGSCAGSSKKATSGTFRHAAGVRIAGRNDVRRRELGTLALAWLEHAGDAKGRTRVKALAARKASCVSIFAFGFRDKHSRPPQVYLASPLQPMLQFVLDCKVWAVDNSRQLGSKAIEIHVLDSLLGCSSSSILGRIQHLHRCICDRCRCLRKAPESYRIAQRCIQRGCDRY